MEACCLLAVGFCINLFTDILFFDKTFVTSVKIPCLSLTSKRMYAEIFLLFIFSKTPNFLFLSDNTNGNLMLPLSMEHKSEIKDEVVGPGPAPSP